MIPPKTILTPIKAIRAHCLDCSGYSSKEADLCTHTACTLYPYRKGKRPKGLRAVSGIEPFLERISRGGSGEIIV